MEKYEYSYDANGNITSVVTNSGTVSYQYDELNQLTQETLLDGTSISYEYDSVGNRTKKIVTVGGTPTTTNYSYNDGNELVTVNGQAFTYDQNGNLTNNGNKTYIYDEENRLIEVKDASNQTIATFTYDHDGKRTSMTTASGTVNYHYSGDKVIYETDASNNIIAEFTYDPLGNPATMTKNGTTYYYHVNGHGDVIALTDGSGNTVAQYSYDAWGNIISQSGSIAAENPLRYAGYRYDEATGLYYLMARYYDPEIGRFITRDTFRGFEEDPLSLNQYAYAQGNPVMYIDPSGHFNKKISFGFNSYFDIATDWWSYVDFTINLTPGGLINVGIGVISGMSVSYLVGKFLNYYLWPTLTATVGTIIAKKVTSNIASRATKFGFQKIAQGYNWLNKSFFYYYKYIGW